MTVTVRSRRDYDSAGAEVWEGSQKRPFRISMTVIDQQGFMARMTVFGNVFPWKGVGPGHTVTVYAETEVWNGQLQIKAPELLPQCLVGRMVALYRGKRGRVAEESVSAAIDVLLKDRVHEAVVGLEREVGMSETEILTGARCRVPDLTTLFLTLHRPGDLKDAFRARDEAREITAFHLRNLARKVKNRKPVADAPLVIDQQQVDQAIRSLPFPLTSDQSKAITEIVADLRSNVPMRRLLSGDVGTGKTLTYLVPAVIAARAGAVVAIVTPNTVLSQQLVDEMGEFFPDTPVALITGSSRKAHNNARVLVGTTALINYLTKVRQQLNWVICDEQHRFGRAQRESLLADGTHLLEATATAIPQTVAVATHGGMDVSILRECPVEKSLITRLVTPEHRRDVFAFLAGLVADGHKIAIIYPRLDDDGREARDSVIAAAAHWERKFPGQVVLVHGRLADKAKAEAIESIKTGEKRILIGTVVIENGITIPQLRGLLVVAPDMYGISQLHQLRGRLARDGSIGYMFMYLNRPVEDFAAETVERLRRIESCTDGFELAEYDAYARGFGDLSDDGQEQNGAVPTLFYGLKLNPADWMHN